MLDVIFALLVREMKVRFGSSRLGYFWAIADPAAQILLFTVVFSVTSRGAISGLDIPVFIMTGVFPFSIFSKLATSLATGIQANRALFVYRQIEPIDPIFTRFLIEVAVYVVTFFVLLVCFAWFGYEIFPSNVLKVLAVNALLLMLGFGVGLSLCSATLYTQEAAKIIPLIIRPMFFISGVFFSTTLIPVKYWHYLSWNPILHLIELHRMAFSDTYYTAFASWSYPFTISIFTLFLGLLLYRVNYYRFVAS